MDTVLSAMVENYEVLRIIGFCPSLVLPNRNSRTGNSPLAQAICCVFYLSGLVPFLYGGQGYSEAGGAEQEANSQCAKQYRCMHDICSTCTCRHSEDSKHQPITYEMSEPAAELIFFFADENTAETRRCAIQPMQFRHATTSMALTESILR